MHAGHLLGMHRLETDGRQVVGILERADLRIGQELQAGLDRDRVVGNRPFSLGRAALRLGVRPRSGRADPLDPAARKYLLRRHVEETVLEAGAAEVCDQDLH